MINRFDKGLARHEILANGIELSQVMGLDRDSEGRVPDWSDSDERLVAVLENPVLVTDSYRIAQLPPTQRDTVFRLLEFPVKATEYDGTVLRFEQGRYPTVWGASIDTLLFFRGMGKCEFPEAAKVLELGTGSGAISKRAIETIPGIVSLDGVDINPLAAACSAETVADPRARFHAGRGEDFLAAEGEYDIMLCNPPYVYRPVELGGSAYEGVGLLVKTIESAPRKLSKGGVLLINYSSLCEEIALSELEKSGLDCRTIDRLTVPLKVSNIMNNPSWLSFLEARGLERSLRQGYEYWHTLNICEVRR